MIKKFCTTWSLFIWRLRSRKRRRVLISCAISCLNFSRIEICRNISCDRCTIHYIFQSIGLELPIHMYAVKFTLPFSNVNILWPGQDITFIALSKQMYYLMWIWQNLLKAFQFKIVIYLCNQFEKDVFFSTSRPLVQRVLQSWINTKSTEKPSFSASCIQHFMQ